MSQGNETFNLSPIMMSTRRSLLLLFAASALALLVSDFGCLSGAAAKDGGSDSGGHGSGGSDGSGSSGSGSNSGSGSGSNSGSSGSSGHGGSDNSGHGNGGSDDNSGHGNADDGADDGDDNSGSSNGNSGKTDNATTNSDKSGNDDHDRARNAVRDGRVLPLKTVLEKIDAGRLGRIIDVDLSHSLAGDIYRLKVRDTKGAIKTFRVDARSGTLLKGN